MKIGRDKNRVFAERAQPHEWLRVAGSLHCQAVRLRRQTSGLIIQSDGKGNELGRWNAENRSVFLLAGFALENAIKAFLVYENPSYISNGTLARTLRSHSLTKLAALSAEIPFKSRTWVLRRFEAGLESWARYPCGVTATDPTDEDVLTERLWSGYLRVMRAYGRRLMELLGELWRGPHGFEGRWTFGGTPQLSEE
jgi:hypothetical protein